MALLFGVKRPQWGDEEAVPAATFAIFDSAASAIHCPWTRLQQRLPLATAEDEEREWDRLVTPEQLTCVRPAQSR